MKILVTGTAGFIGFHLANVLASRGDEVIGIDNINDYYDPHLKYARLKEAGVIADTNLGKSIVYNQLIKSSKYPHYQFIKLDITDKDNLEILFKEQQFDAVCNLAAQAAVRYSITHPQAYIDSNIVGFANVLENARNYDVENFSYASSSSVYGLNQVLPFSTSDNADHPISIYAASKKSNELMAYSYAHLFGIKTTGLRFFTVYGPWGRPDMAPFLFTKAALENTTIEVFNYGDMQRDFTYIDDIIEGVVKVIDHPASSDDKCSGKQLNPATSSAPWVVYNIGNSAPVHLLSFIEAIEHKLGKTINKKMLPMQPGDLAATFADINPLVENLGYQPKTTIQSGVNHFIDWYLEYSHK